MDLTSYMKDGCTVLELYGQLDQYSACDVAEWMQQAAAVSSEHVVVDLLEADIMDTAALHAIIRGIEAIIHTHELHLPDGMVKEQVDEPAVAGAR